MRIPPIWVSEQVDRNRPVQSQKQAGNLKFQINCEADLRLCFRLFKLMVFSCQGSYVYRYVHPFYICA